VNVNAAMSDPAEGNCSSNSQENSPSYTDEKPSESGDAAASQSSPTSPADTASSGDQVTDNNAQQQSNTQPTSAQQQDNKPVCNGTSEPVTATTESSQQQTEVVRMNEDDVVLVSNKTNAFPPAYSPVATNTGNGMTMRVTANEMEVMELKVKVICQEKNILALRMELKAAELQVEAKNKIDEKKTRLVELLDNKLAATEKRNAKMIDMLEQMLKEKDSNTNRLKDATKNMTDLSQRLQDSERIKTELLRVNAELRKMLENIETKGSQIAKLAKEKVLKYRSENDAMQLELNTLKEAGPGASETDSLAALGVELAAATSRVAVDSSACDELWSKITEIQEQISTALKRIDASQLDDLRQTVQDASDANAALKVSMEEARVKTGEDLTALSTENDQLRSLIDDFDVTRKKMEKSEANNRNLLAEQKNNMTAKEKEIVELKDELQRLKGAIGQLIGAK